MIPALVQLNAPIIPGKELAGVQLGVKIATLQHYVAELGGFQLGSYELVSPFQACYRFSEGKVELFVDVRNGKVFKITAKSGYTGKLFGNICIGLLVKDAIRYCPELYYDEPEEVVVCKNADGVAIEVSGVDPPVELVLNLPIYAISVYIPELNTAAGQLGEW